MKPNFEWDEKKALINIRKHHISFEEATSIFQDELSLTIEDTSHSKNENRFIDIGRSSKGRILVVVYTECSNIIRIISCRKATSTERNAYETKIE